AVSRRAKGALPHCPQITGRAAPNAGEAAGSALRRPAAVAARAQDGAPVADHPHLAAGGEDAPEIGAGVAHLRRPGAVADRVKDHAARADRVDRSGAAADGVQLGHAHRRLQYPAAYHRVQDGVAAADDINIAGAYAPDGEEVV